MIDTDPQSYVQKLLVEMRARGVKNFHMNFYGQRDNGSPQEFWIDNELSLPSSKDEKYLWAMVFYELVKRVDEYWYDLNGGRAVITIDITTGKVSVRLSINASKECEYDYGS